MTRRMPRLFLIIVSVLYIIVQPTVVQALSQGDINAIYGDSVYYDPNACGSSDNTSSGTEGGSLASGSKVYILGDSITAMAQAAYVSGFQQKGITASVDGSSGRSLNGPGIDGNKLTGMAAIAADKTQISGANAVVVALGTNGGNTTQSIDQAIQAIRTINSNAPIYWVDTMVVGRPDYVSTINDNNQAIYEQAKQDKYAVISWAKKVTPNVDQKHLTGQEADSNGYIIPYVDPNKDASLGVHPTAAGVAALTSLVTTTVAGGSTTSSTSTSDTSPSSSTNNISSTFILGFSASTPHSVIEGVVKKYHVAGIVILGTTNAVGNGFTKSFIDTLNKDNGSPLIIGTDEEGASIHRYNHASSFPNAIDMGKMPVADVKTIGLKIGQDLAANGVTTDLAPVLDVSKDSSGIDAGTAGRAFSNDPNVVADKAGAFAAGLNSAGIKPVYKHFPGIGTITGNTDNAPAATVSLDQLKAKDLIPYKKIVNNNGAAVMMSNASTPGLTGAGEVASTSQAAVSLLRNNYGFSGLIMSDDLGVKGVGLPLPQAIVKSLKAGVDAPLFTYSNDADIDAAVAAAKSAGVNVSTNLSNIRSFQGTPTTTGQVTGSGCCAGSGTILAGTDNKQKTWNYFISKGLTAAQTAGIMGNLEAESSIEPTRLQSTPSGTVTPSASLSQSQLSDGQLGWGIVQWTPPGKMINPVLSSGGNPDLLSTQLDFLWAQLTDPSSPSSELDAGTALKASTDVDSAAVSFGHYERFAGWEDPNNPRYAERKSLAEATLAQYGNGASGGSNTTGSSGSCENSGGGSGQQIENVNAYFQTDPQWVNVPYGSSAIGPSGCGPTSLATVISTLKGDKSITPATVAADIGSQYYIPGSGTSWGAFTAEPTKYGLTTTHVSGSSGLQQAMNATKNGALVIVSMHQGLFTSGGHIMVLRGLTDDGKIKVVDVGESTAHHPKTDTTYTYDQITSNSTNGGEYWIITK